MQNGICQTSLRRNLHIFATNKKLLNSFFVRFITVFIRTYLCIFVQIQNRRYSSPNLYRIIESTTLHFPTGYSDGVVPIKSRLFSVIRIECRYVFTFIISYCFLFISSNLVHRIDGVRLIFFRVKMNWQRVVRVASHFNVGGWIFLVFILSTRKMSAIKSIVRDFQNEPICQCSKKISQYLIKWKCQKINITQFSLHNSYSIS